MDIDSCISYYNLVFFNYLPTEITDVYFLMYLFIMKYLSTSLIFGAVAQDI